jgi:hypothetical protein
MPSLNLRNLSGEFVRRIKAKAALSGLGIRDYAVSVLQADLIGGDASESRASVRSTITADGAASSKTRNLEAKVAKTKLTGIERRGPDSDEAEYNAKPESKSNEPWTADSSDTRRRLAAFVDARGRKPESGAEWYSFLKRGY